MNTHNPAVAFPIPKVRAEHHRFFVSVKSASVTITLPKILLMTRDPQPKTCLFNRPLMVGSEPTPGHTDDRLMAMALAWYRTRELQLRREKLGDLPSYLYYHPPIENEGVYSWLREAMKEWENERQRGQLIRPLSEVLGESAL
jgi:hypothetical protein